jgi:hypothetical protein
MNGLAEPASTVYAASVVVSVIASVPKAKTPRTAKSAGKNRILKNGSSKL